MLTDRTQALLAAIEHQVEASQAALAAERDRARALEAENLALKERLLALAELDPSLISGNAHPEDPDGGSRARGLGSLAFRRPKTRHETHEEEVPRPTPLQRFTSPNVVKPEGVPQPEAHAATSSAESRGDVREALSDGAAPGEAERSERVETGPAEPDTPEPEGDSLSPQALLAQWHQRYPQTFFKGHTRPLKTGIHLDLCEREPWPEKLVRRALACYVHLPRYLKSVREGTKRVDLDGADSDIVTQEEAKHAKRQLEALQKKQKARQSERRADSLDRKIGELLAKHGQSPS
ncbi:ProQ/FINO family protein [Salinicola halophilus]|uniref:ProQ/FINO family protein n=1 Tax=Salinicola halophilus TaxID=184065 RepID=UPI001EF8CDD5|nr:ProQ/FINO family protein [Salinicola halophilus]